MNDDNPFGKDYINDESSFKEPEPDHGSEMEDNPDNEVVSQIDRRIYEEEQRLHLLKEVRGAIRSLQTDLDVEIEAAGCDPMYSEVYKVTLKFKNEVKGNDE